MLKGKKRLSTDIFRFLHPSIPPFGFPEEGTMPPPLLTTSLPCDNFGYHE
jgi:hypothetical protein